MDLERALKIDFSLSLQSDGVIYSSRTHCGIDMPGCDNRNSPKDLGFSVRQKTTCTSAPAHHSNGHNSTPNPETHLLNQCEHFQRPAGNHKHWQNMVIGSLPGYLEADPHLSIDAS
jgi:hypothetical protein